MCVCVCARACNILKYRHETKVLYIVRKENRILREVRAGKNDDEVTSRRVTFSHEYLTIARKFRFELIYLLADV